MSSLLENFQTIRRRHKELQDLMVLPKNITDSKKMTILGREYSKLDKLNPLLDQYEQSLIQISDNKELIQTETDVEFLEMAKMEIEELSELTSELEKKLLDGLLPVDPSEGKNIIVEVRAGTGGDEAGLFAGDLFRMYMRLSERRGWKLEIMDSNATDIGGYKEITFQLSGDDAYTSLKFEGGVHRVQRVPRTETSGRIHTSAAAVMIFPEAENEEIEINDKDLRIDYFAASGCGGQHVNRTYSAVRIVHTPTGIIATCQDEKSQHKNRDKAMTVLRARLFQMQEEERLRKLESSRKSQVRSGDRSEKIRTYNFQQNRITDHRVGFTAHNLTEVLDGDMDALIEALQNAEIQEFLESLNKDN